MNFCLVGGTPASAHLTDIKVTGYSYPADYDEEFCFVGDVQASKLNQYGQTVADGSGNAIMWYWNDWYEGDVHVCGWVDGDGMWIGTDVDDVPLAMGEGLWLASDNPKWTIQCAGEVYNQKLPCQLVNGNRFCVNPCPKAINLTDCIIGGYEYPTDYDEDDCFVGVITASKLNQYGSTVSDGSGNPIMWFWNDWYEGDVQVCGWVDGDGMWIGTDVDDVPLAMGEGLWVASDSTKWQFVFPKTIE